MNTLLTIGDSFTAGEELTNVAQAWPFLLANKIGYTLNNQGISGSDNTRMVRCLLEQNIDNYDLVIIAWSYFDRIEIADEAGIYHIWPGGERKSVVAQGEWRKDIIKFITYHHNDAYLYRQYLINIILVQQYLKSHSKKYVMVDAFGNHIAPGRTDVDNQDLMSKIDTTYFLGWPFESMQEWTTNLPKGPGTHFLEQGHVAIANKLYNFLVKNNYV
jgi:lysophospholipase L1-like esterase